MTGKLPDEYSQSPNSGVAQDSQSPPESDAASRLAAALPETLTR